MCVQLGICEEAKKAEIVGVQHVIRKWKEPNIGDMRVERWNTESRKISAGMESGNWGGKGTQKEGGLNQWSSKMEIYYFVKLLKYINLK